MFSKANLRRIGLSALKAFGAAALAVVIARQSDILHSTPGTLKSVAFAAIVAGLDAAFKAVQVKLEG